MVRNGFLASMPLNITSGSSIQLVPGTDKPLAIGVGLFPLG